MNWEHVNRYAFETLGQVRTAPIGEWDKLTGGGVAYDGGSEQPYAYGEGMQNEPSAANLGVCCA